MGLLIDPVLNPFDIGKEWFFGGHCGIIMHDLLKWPKAPNDKIDWLVHHYSCANKAASWWILMAPLRKSFIGTSLMPLTNRLLHMYIVDGNAKQSTFEGHWVHCTVHALACNRVTLTKSIGNSRGTSPHRPGAAYRWGRSPPTHFMNHTASTESVPIMATGNKHRSVAKWFHTCCQRNT